MTEVPGVFTTPENASASLPETRIPRAFCLAAVGHEHGPVRPMAPFGKRPLTPLSRIPLLFALTHLRACRPCLPPAHVRGGRRTRVGRRRNPPRPPPPPVREDQRLRSTRGAFHRQGPFLGSGGHYSPGPATTAPPEGEMRRPLDDALTSPWAFPRARSVIPKRSGVATFRSTDRKPPTCDRRGSRRSRSPFTRPCRSFWSAFDELLRDQASPADFCNCIRRAGTNLELFGILAGTSAVTPFLF